MLAWALNIDFAGSGVPDAPSVPTQSPRGEVARSSPSSWQKEWRSVGWIRLRPLPVWGRA